MIFSINYKQTLGLFWRYIIMAWHTTKEGGTTQKCVKYPERVGYTTILVGGFSTILSHQGRNDWMELVNPSDEYRAYRTAEQRLLSIQYQQQAVVEDLSWAMATREKFFHNRERDLYELGKNWVATGPVGIGDPKSQPS